MTQRARSGGARARGRGSEGLPASAATGFGARSGAFLAILAAAAAAAAFGIACGAGVAVGFADAQAAPGGPSFPEPQGYVTDLAGALSPGLRSRLESTLQAVDERFAVQVAVVATKDIGDEDPTDYATRLYESWRIGNKKTHRGLLLLDVIRGPGRSFFRVEVGYGLEGVLPDGRVGRILDESVMPLLREGERGQAYVAAVRELLAPVLREMNEDPAELDALLAQSGWQRTRAGRRGGSPLPSWWIIVLILIVLSMASRRRRRGAMIWGGPFGGFGGFGGFGSFGGGGGGGFGGFGGGLSGGGGAGRGY